MLQPLRRDGLLDACQERYVVNEPLAEPVERTRQHEHARQHQQHTHHHFDVAQMSPEPLQERDEGPDCGGREHERHAKPQRIDEEQANARAEAALVGGQRQHRCQHRPDARRPAKGEGEPHHKGANEARPFRTRLKARLAIEQRHAQQPQEMQAETDDHCPGNDCQPALVRLHPLAEGRRTGTQRDKHRGKPEHEQEGREHHAPPQVVGYPGLIRHLLDGRAAEIAEVRRHQRQHAG